MVRGCKTMSERYSYLVIANILPKDPPPLVPPVKARKQSLEGGLTQVVIFSKNSVFINDNR